MHGQKKHQASATVITGEVNGTGCCKSETQQYKTTPPWVRRTQESINGIRKDLPALAEIKRDEIKTKNMKRKRLLTKYNIEKEENLDHVMRELKLKVSKKTQRLFRYRKRQNQYYQNKICADRLKKFLQHSQTKKYQCEKCTH